MQRHEFEKRFNLYFENKRAAIYDTIYDEEGNFLRYRRMTDLVAKPIFNDKQKRIGWRVYADDDEVNAFEHRRRYDAAKEYAWRAGLFEESEIS